MSGLGKFSMGEKVTFTVTTHDTTDGSSSDATAAPNYEVYEDETGTPIVASTAMATLNDAGTVGFYSEQLTLDIATGYEYGKSYTILVEATVGSIAAATSFQFQIDSPSCIWQSEIATLSSQTSFTLDDGSADDDAYNGHEIMIIDQTDNFQRAVGVVSDYTGSTKTVTLAADPNTGFVMATNDIVHISKNKAPLQPTNIGRTLDVAATGEAGIDLDNTTGTLAAAQIATNAITSDKIAADAIGSSEFAQAAADKVWDTAARILTASTNFNDLSTADIDARLAAIGLDHLLSAAVIGTDVADNSIFARLVSSAATADWDTFVNTTDALQAIRDHATTIKDETALIVADTNELQTDDVPGLIAALNNITAADVWAAATRTLTANTNFNDPTAAAIARLILPQVNTAFSNIEFEMYDDTNHNPATGLTVTGQRSLNGGAYANVTGTIAEVGNGTYQFDASSGDMNGAMITFRFSATNADDTYVHLKTAA